MLFLIGLAELPGYLIVIFLVDITGRRCLCSFLMFVGGLACIAVAFIPQGKIHITHDYQYGRLTFQVKIVLPN